VEEAFRKLSSAYASGYRKNSQRYAGKKEPTMQKRDSGQ
jgi:hypothetical protein